MTNELERCPNPECDNGTEIVLNVLDGPVRGTELYQCQCAWCKTTGPAVRVQDAGNVESRRIASEEARDKWAAMPRRPVWTTELPAAPGYYWRRFKKRSAEIFEMSGDGRIYKYGRWQHQQISGDIEFAGPIPEPEQPK